MHELTPTFVANKGYSTTHFDMDAVEAIGLVKMDILAQGGLAVMRDVKESLASDRGLPARLDLPSAKHASVSSSDPSPPVVSGQDVRAPDRGLPARLQLPIVDDCAEIQHSSSGV